LYPSPVACPDPSQKKCGGPCVKPSPANGCSLVTCVDCAGVANGVQTCAGTRCDFQCNPGYEVSGSGCVISAGTDAGAGTPDLGACTVGTACTSRVCKAGSCRPALCNDGVKNGLETDVDCGGSCGPCAPGKQCGGNADCAAGPCNSGVCGCTPLVCGAPALTGLCGSNLDDNCGGKVAACLCGSGGETCYQGACCDPQAACQTACGTISACGQSIDCGTLSCTSAQTCYQSKCCTPAKQCAAGSCGTQSDGCGGRITCAGCTNGRICTAGACTCDGTDTDGDGLTDCAELDDGNPWTDPAIWNGLIGATYDKCAGGNPACTGIDTNAEVTACMAKPVIQGQNLGAGWGFADNNANRCDAAYAFKPNWTQTCNDNTFSVSYTGFINLTAGTHCFDIAGANSNACGVFFLDGSDAKPVTHASGPQCYTVTAGAHAVRLFFDRAAAAFLQTGMGFNWQHCVATGAATTCTPTVTVPQSDVRITN
jgi:hypothetical protein